MKANASLFLGLLGLAAQVSADPTWPSDIDELEEIMYQVFSFRSRKFADTVAPCSNEASGPGRHNSAEWLRTAFHDMSTANTVLGFGGLDASLQYELSPNGENTGPGFATTMSFMAPYMTRKSSMSDLIALGVYTSVRSCGGPVVPIRAGRVDATSAGNTGVPQPQNDITIFRNQFARMGFTPQEMIQVTACGHTIGGVHNAEFPDIIPTSAPNGQIGLDSTDAVFDNKVVTEYLDGTTQNPLVVGPAVALKKHSDFKVFSSDGNVTVRAMADAAAFNSVCKTVFQKMIDVVPPGVTLSAPIEPYMIKPVNLHLTLAPGSTTLTFTGFIRVRTTNLPVSTIAGLTLNYKNRNGGTTCGSGPCTMSLSVQGIGRGFDDTFAFYPISASIPVSSGISSFTVTVRMTDGSSTVYDNNGNGYPMQDGVLLQMPQSCLLQGTGASTLVAAVRNDRANLPVKAILSYKVKRTESVVPSLNSVTLDMTKGTCYGSYTFFSVDYNIPGGLSFESFVDVVSGDGASVMTDSFKDLNEIGGTCQAYSGSTTCGSVSVSTTSAVPTSTRTSTSSAAPTATLSHRPTIGGYKLVSCWTEGTTGRALTGPNFAYDGMTLETCMSNCTGFDYWGTEYGRECYCGNSLSSNSAAAPLGDCNMVCSGDSTQYCGAGNRLELYSTTATRTTTSVAAPTGTLVHLPTVGKYSLVGCQTEGAGVRALDGAATAADDMTLDKCATFCSAFTYFGTEYGRECYCGNSLAASSATAPMGDCSMTCAGNPFQYCGAGNRIELYKVGGATSTTLGTSVRLSTTSASSTGPTTSSAVPSSTLTRSSSTSRATTSSISSTRVSSTSRAPSTSTSRSSNPTTSTNRSQVSSSTAKTSTASSTVPTLAHKPTVSPYTLAGCWTEGNGVRALSQKSYASGDKMTLESCASFCAGFKYFGTEYSSECYCGDFLATSSTNVSLSECSMTCSGDQYEYCGGPSRLTLYQTDSPVTGPSQPATVGAYTFFGCQTEPTTGVRALTGAATASDTMTNEACAAFCADFTYFGTEYGRECYCGNSLPATSLSAPASECSMLCSGTSGQFCGAGSRLSVYKK